MTDSSAPLQLQQGMPYTFSQAFTLPSTATTWNSLPAGYLGVITYMSVGINVSSSTAGQWVVAVGSATNYIWFVNLPSGFQFMQWAGFVVWLPGTTAEFNWDSGSNNGVQWYVGGYLLPLTNHP